MIETGTRSPSLSLLDNIAEILGISRKMLLGESLRRETESEEPYYYEIARDYMELLRTVQRERRLRMDLEEYAVMIKRKLEHITTVLHLYLQLGDIAHDKQLSQSEKKRKREQLARVTAQEGEVTFQDMLSAFRVQRSELKAWIVAEKEVYRCKHIEGQEVLAATPGEAALRFCCFDCTYFERRMCDGFGNERRPENLIELLERLEENGIYNRSEQAQILQESYSLKLSEHQICEIVYRHKKGIPLPEESYNLMAKK